MLRRSMSKREKLSKTLRNRSSRSNLRMREKMQYNWRSMKILKSSKGNSSRTWNWTTKSSWNKMRSSMRLFQKVSLVSERR
jgi:hypothetical protein